MPLGSLRVSGAAEKLAPLLLSPLRTHIPSTQLVLHRVLDKSYYNTNALGAKISSAPRAAISTPPISNDRLAYLAP